MRLGIGIDVLIFWKPTRSRYTFLAADCMALEKPLTRYRHSAGGTPQGPRCDADASRRIRGVGARLASLDFAPPAPTRSLRASESRFARSLCYGWSVGTYCVPGRDTSPRGLKTAVSKRRARGRGTT